MLRLIRLAVNAADGEPNAKSCSLVASLLSG
ncbi:hypothetical protein FHS27_005629 [Rhodopirellula rubra]|uniref:Uncharacterized protein n=1 Tax=Aporhodopirellula rubra TaxID=980271 RepID=A0A7W5E430_9BACT|nr:hypothetical protein [Aporhodopirellula rubra]